MTTPCQRINSTLERLRSYTPNDEAYDDLYTFFSGCVLVNGVWEFYDCEGGYNPKEEEREFEFDYLITEENIYVLMDGMYEYEIDDTWRRDEYGYRCDKYVVQEAIYDYICDQQQHIPALNTKKVKLVYRTQDLEDLLNRSLVKKETPMNMTPILFNVQTNKNMNIQERERKTK